MILLIFQNKQQFFPPANVNEDFETDEDSGDENFVVPNNLPGTQLRAEVEVEMPFEENSEHWDSDDLYQQNF